ncbi:MAG: ABC transporter substrate-binding protein [Reichenbachiella sp.]|uniref:ABC transporter substrate-binding protein n=1 Tax=Reichenbachiella sp. TaxID=2184521 RepID=UPI00329A11BE
MLRLLKFVLFCPLFSLLAWQAVAQSEQSDYLKAKQYFAEGNYRFAMDYFRRLAGNNQDHAFQEYAAYYYGLSAYKNGDTTNAKAMWLQMDEENEDWKQIREVHHYLAEIYFAQSNFNRGVYYAKKSGLDESKAMMKQSLTKIDSLPVLEALNDRFPEDEMIARIVADQINAQPMSARDFQLLNRLVNQFNLNKEKYGLPEIGESQMKESYHVAVLLPFMFEDLSYTARVERNKFVMELYAGMLMAVDSINLDGKHIKIFPYDTKRNSEITEAIFSSPEMKSMDLIVGPLFPGPSKVANNFSFENQINMINPLISNSDAIQNNPFSFLFKADTETQALAAAQLTIDSVKNKYAMIFYENNERDSLNAYTYSQRIQEAGFEVLINAGVVDTTVRQAYNLLTEKYEVGYTKDEVDSILAMTLSGKERFIKERKSSTKKDSIEYYEEFFTLAPDSIGHVYVASSEALFASNFISALSIRADSTQLIGRGNWKEFPTLTLEEMERLGIYFIDPEFVDPTNEIFKKFRRNYLKTYKKEPSFNAIIGYEMMYYVGNMMKQYGHYFQKGNPEVGFVKGQLLQGTEFNFRNSNQYVPITILSNSKQKVVNTRSNGQNQ